jgi:hypothetical protein
LFILCPKLSQEGWRGRWPAFAMIIRTTSEVDGSPASSDMSSLNRAQTLAESGCWSMHSGKKTAKTVARCEFCQFRTEIA